MSETVHDTGETLGRLEALLASGVLTQAEAASCAGLAQALRRPARVAVLGQSAADLTGVLRAMLGEKLVTLQPGGPAVELRHGATPVHVATFEDGSSLSQEGAPPADLLSYGPVFLVVEAPHPVLSSMSFLAVELDEEAEDHAPALAWAAKRCEIAIFCATDFGDSEAAIWAIAPDRLKNHCYLVVTGDRDTGSARARGLFDAVIHAPAPSEAAAPLRALQHRLAADIAAARQEDIDAAELFLHRFRRAAAEAEASTDRGAAADQAGEDAPASPADDAGPGEDEAQADKTQAEKTQAQQAPADEAKADRAQADTAQADEAAAGPRAGAGSAAARALVSGPILHLKRRSRALAELLEWREEAEDWSAEVLEHCFETAEALRDLVAAWPDDDAVARRLREAVDQACDTVVLLQVESGPDQAEDAARVLYQLRTDFEQEMAA
jgi:chemotaxis protein histidine kinase CheA